jgi:hypothetical protein
MRDDLLGLLEKADLALASSHGVIEEEALAPLIAAVNDVRTRLAHPEEILVVALAGGTGSGKSSLFNAFAGVELVDTGGIRPTTSHPAAAVPADAADSLTGYLDRLGIEERHTYDTRGVCLIDLPDTDSVELEHRHRVDSMLPLVDVVVWVTDPEKYRDARFHNDYLKPMSQYAAQFIFVMNQVDRLTPARADAVCNDLVTALDADGLDGVAVIPMAAAPPSGPPIGMDRLSSALQAKRESRAGLYGKLLTDLATTSTALEDQAGSGLDFDARAEQAVSAAAEFLATDDSPAAVATLAGFLDSLAVEVRAGIADRINHLAADVASHVDRIERDLAQSRTPERKSWFRRRQGDHERPDIGQARALLSEAVIRPARAVLARRALAIASIAELALDVQSLRRERPR